jgi:5'-nucleotidase
MNRRHFLKSGALGAAALTMLGPNVLAASRSVKLTILHTNDQHSRIDPFPMDGRDTAGKGGMAHRAALIKQIRQQEKNVLLLDSGDIFQGTPYFNFFGGELEYKLMSQMGYDVATLGNHDFDNGLTGLERQLQHAKFPFVIANYDFSQTQLAGRFKSYQILEREGIRIGVFGIGIELAGLVAEKLHGNTKHLDPIQKATETAAILRKKEKCDLVICLSHLGYKYDTSKVSDQVLATQVPGLDLILGGHTHTFLEKPDVLTGPNGKTVLVNQVGWAGLRLGRIDFIFEKNARNPQVVSAAALPVGGTESMNG